MSEPLILIPARMASTRLPGKPLADIRGAPMIVHVWRRAVESKAGRVAVAAAEPEIADAVRKAGGEAVLTKPDHPSGSDRIFEAAMKLDPEGRHDIVVNLQGDLPTLNPALITAVLQPLATPLVDIATLATPIKVEAERTNPNVTKAIITFGHEHDGETGRALYFTRATAPWGEGPLFHHIGMYAYRRKALEHFVSLPPSPLEKRERLEQLRALEAGLRVDVHIVDTVPLGVDTPEDLERARALLDPKGKKKS
ncbi:MAG: 3-deoxy-manno-octulosonate cytidylyltransferase [Alphaproteobacteria bacterium]|nr:3-deoxy-manno-octulosonate cytidylyltransferase [Alphaproteobacteria bacterium]